MKVEELNNSYKLSELDLYDNNDIKELGDFVSKNQVVFIDSSVEEERLFEIQSSWGEPSRAAIHEAVINKQLSGRHWREIFLHLGYIAKKIPMNLRTGMSRVSFVNEGGKPTGIFENNDILWWHSDQPSVPDSQRMIGLMSISGTEGSSTSFLDTNVVYENLNYEDKKLADELITVWKWDGGTVSPGLKPEQVEVTKYFFCPLDGLETPLINSTSYGKKGFKFPTNCFGNFKGMSQVESDKVRDYFWRKINKPEYIYEHKWKDGQLCFMDQSITLHARLTSVSKSSTRTLARCVSYLDKIIDNSSRKNYVYYKGDELNYDEFLNLVDQKRREEFYGQTNG